MERHIQIVLNRLSCISIVIASLTLLFLLLQTPETCVTPGAAHKPHLRFPKSSCDSSHREHVPIEKKNKRLWSTKIWQKSVSSYYQFFQAIQDLGLLNNHSKVLCVSAGAGHEVMALSEMGLLDVTGIELVDSPPLVSRADPHNLPFFDDAFDLAFSGHLAEALFPSRFASEMERTVRPGGVCLLVVEECGDDEYPLAVPVKSSPSGV
ncbi:S-adenosyl-L-methionine-dependent methyltransferase-like protein [Quillaja saponaria]|uniref:S-adenosyl-L-methionine-dependent methyltransferase-like protein n=1 Tax=Quillaja saponaria TaxID=32244 RepID=A0AAD7QH06_QUISA|nr:S-adenosyl-L-methionine-dependent methyltransferase-like protein [Quillaja saponaria]